MNTQRIVRQLLAELERGRTREGERPGPQRRAACFRGHELAGENVITRANGTRTCRACHRERVKAHEHKRAARKRPYVPRVVLASLVRS